MDADFFRNLEAQLLDPTTRKDRRKLLSLLAENFVEFASSGGSYNREQVILSLLEENPTSSEISDFKVFQIDPHVALVTYASERFFPTMSTRKRYLRSSIWQQMDDRWQMVFHQGTPQP